MDRGVERDRNVGWRSEGNNVASHHRAESIQDPSEASCLHGWPVSVTLHFNKWSSVESVKVVAGVSTDATVGHRPTLTHNFKPFLPNDYFTFLGGYGG